MQIPENERFKENEKTSETGSENARLNVNSPGGGDDDLEMQDQSGFMLRGDVDDPVTIKWGAQGCSRPSYIFITVILILTILAALIPVLYYAADTHSSNSTHSGNDSCMDSCRITLVESIPTGLVYSNDSVSHPSIYHSWMELIALAQSSIEIVTLKWTMRRLKGFPAESAKQGEDVFEALLEAGRDRGVQLRFVRPNPLLQFSPNHDAEYLAEKANAQIRSLNFPTLLGSGLMHTKFWLIDRTHVYIGSANMDWRSMTELKELGLLAVNCSCLANDIGKIFDLYWKISDDGKVSATSWPESLTTKINLDNPMNLTLDENKYRVFIASSPSSLLPNGRTDDLDAILHCIDKAEKFIYISVANYFPLFIYTSKIKYWPVIDDALRSAAIDRKIQIRLLISWWKHTAPSTGYFLKSLAALTNSYTNVRIEVKIFIVPTTAEFDEIQLKRATHNKFMVTDAAAYIGTSNWSGDYFIANSGIGIVFEAVGHENEGNIRQQVEDIFVRDWNSRYSYPLDEIYPTEEIVS